MHILKPFKLRVLFFLAVGLYSCGQPPKPESPAPIESEVKDTNHQISLFSTALTDTLFIPSDTGQIELINFHDAEDASQVFTRLNDHDYPNAHLIKASYYESIEYLLINKISGQIDTLFNVPLISPNDSLFIVITPDTPYEGAIHGYEIWKLNGQNNWRRIQGIFQKNYHPLSAFWLSESEIVLTIAPMELNAWNAATIDYNNTDTLRIQL